MGRKTVVLIALSALVLIYSRPIAGTIYFGSDASGLMTLSMRHESEHSFNPFRKDTILITPKLAEWMLHKFDWPYQRDPRENMSICPEWQSYIHAAIANRNWRTDDVEVNERMMRLLANFVDRGYSLEARHCGYTPLQAAILFGDVESVQFLIEHGADATAIIHKPGRRSDGLNAYEFAEMLFAGKHPDWHKATVTYLRSRRK